MSHILAEENARESKRQNEITSQSILERRRDTGKANGVSKANLGRAGRRKPGLESGLESLQQWIDVACPDGMISLERSLWSTREICWRREGPEVGRQLRKASLGVSRPVV